VVIAANTQTNRISTVEARGHGYHPRAFGYTRSSRLTRTS
jgi:hypothetical protein